MTTDARPENRVTVRGLPGLDEPIYRVFPLWYFEQTLRLRHLVLARPDLWEDPYEVLGTSVMVTVRDTRPFRQVPLPLSGHAAYAQCWSRTNESDTLLRAYSRVVRDPGAGRNTCPRDEGVGVRSTLRKLLHAFAEWPEATPSTTFIGAVEYLSAAAIHRSISDAVMARGLSAFATPEAHAGLLLLKRLAFAHESEIRVLHFRPERQPMDRTIGVPFDPNSVFDQVAYDPRLLPFERVEREAAARALGYTGEFANSGLYQGVLLNVVVDRLIDEPPPTSPTAP